jgi:uncharacterized membrane protein
MLLSIKLTVVPILSLGIFTLLGVLLYKIFSAKAKRDTIALLIVIITFLFGIIVMMNLQNEKGEYYWKSVNQDESPARKQP